MSRTQKSDFPVQVSANISDWYLPHRGDHCIENRLIIRKSVDTWNVSDRHCCILSPRWRWLGYVRNIGVTRSTVDVLKVTSTAYICELVSNDYKSLQLHSLNSVPFPQLQFWQAVTESGFPSAALDSQPRRHCTFSICETESTRQAFYQTLLRRRGREGGATLRLGGIDIGQKSWTLQFRHAKRDITRPSRSDMQNDDTPRFSQILLPSGSTCHSHMFLLQINSLWKGQPTVLAAPSKVWDWGIGRTLALHF